MTSIKPKLFNMDLHISVIADFKNIFPEFDITDWSLSGHTWVFGNKTATPEIINAGSWLNLNMKMISNFQERYDDFLKTFDGFICGHPNGFALLYEKYNKPIILINTCRYDLPFCMSKDIIILDEYHACLQRLLAKGLLIAVSNNRADQKYIYSGTGIITKHIPSLCAYTNMKYRPERSTFLCYHGSTPAHPLITQKNELPSRFKWSDIETFRGIIHFPYEVSTMSMFEHYTAGMPLFFPTKKYMMDNCSIQSILAYWGDQLPEKLYDFRKKQLWIDNADFYTVFKSPNIYYFDSISHLFELLEKFEWKDDSAILEEYCSSIRNDWLSVLTPHFNL